MGTQSIEKWSPDSWRVKKIRQQPDYEDRSLEAKILSEIRSLPPLVASGEVDSLRKKLADAAQGKRFVLQGGDCAERFLDCRPDSITTKLKILLQMSLILSYGARKPVVRVGRIAGQYAKPRSADSEIVGGVTMGSFRGDNINSFEPKAAERRADPGRLLQSYHYATLTLNYIRALITGGFADLQHPEHWDLSHYSDDLQRQRYAGFVTQIQDAIDFMTALGGIKEETLGSVDFYTSHEGLLLGYEESLTRFDESTQRFYNLGAHMLWIGERTRALDEAHVEYFRGIANPIGVKIGPTASPDEIVDVIRRLNPLREAGKVTLITRFGHENVAKSLPQFVKGVVKSQEPVLWSCDPMHGNTIRSVGDIKTRDFDAILSELEQTFRIHRDAGSHLGGVHFELTGENVTECIGGSEGIKPEDLSRHYQTYCDPRLNYSQSLEMAFLISRMLRGL